jgi:hypothetical protein
VLRYFDLAGPHHHEDEERHLFPRLRDHPDARVREAVATLAQDHARLHALWQRLRAVLLRWRAADAPPPVGEDERALVRPVQRRPTRATSRWRRRWPTRRRVPCSAPSDLRRIGRPKWPPG